MIRALVDLAEKKGLRGLVAPVRPSAKVKHPWVPISEYLSWTDPKGRRLRPLAQEPSGVGRQAHWTVRAVDGGP